MKKCVQDSRGQRIKSRYLQDYDANIRICNGCPMLKLYLDIQNSNLHYIDILNSLLNIQNSDSFTYPALTSTHYFLSLHNSLFFILTPDFRLTPLALRLPFFSLAPGSLSLAPFTRHLGYSLKSPCFSDNDPPVSISPWPQAQE